MRVMLKIWYRSAHPQFSCTLLKLKLNPSKPLRLIEPVLIPGFSSVKRIGAFTPPGQDASLSQVSFPASLVLILQLSRLSRRSLAQEHNADSCGQGMNQGSCISRPKPHYYPYKKACGNCSKFTGENTGKPEPLRVKLCFFSTLSLHQFTR